MFTKLLYSMRNVRPISNQYLAPGTYLANAVSVNDCFGNVSMEVHVETYPMVNGGPKEALWQRANEYRKEMEAAKQLVKELQDKLLKERAQNSEAICKIDLHYRTVMETLENKLKESRAEVDRYRKDVQKSPVFEMPGMLESIRRMNDAMTNAVRSDIHMKRFEVHMEFSDGKAIRTVHARHADTAVELAIQSARMAEGGPQFSGELISAYAKHPK